VAHKQTLKKVRGATQKHRESSRRCQEKNEQRFEKRRKIITEGFGTKEGKKKSAKKTPQEGEEGATIGGREGS